MGRQQRKERAASSGDPHKAAIIKLMREFTHSHDPYTVFADFVEVSAIAISSKVDKSQFEAREKRYLEIVGKYKREEVNRFAAMFAELQMCYRTRIDAIGDPGSGHEPAGGLGDVLGEIFMALELGNARAGQFFTPYSVSLLMAMMTVGDGASVREQGFVTLQEPACGSAGMVVATAQAMHQVGLNYPESLHATCVDIDPRCVHMAYVQLSLMGIPAVVVHGNALSLEVWSVWYTPAHIFVGWGRKLRRGRQELPVEPGASPAEDAGLQESGIESPEAATTGDVETHSGSCGQHGGHTAVCDDRETDLAVAVEEIGGGGEPLTVASSLADLFEEVARKPEPKRTEFTIFDRIDQMTLF
ncbi:N-6 DNA methylase (plasmid) [Paraburkholderia strydomiana]